MSDLNAELTAAVATALRQDADVIAAFGSNPVQIFDVVPTDAAQPYLQLPGGAVEPIEAEGFALSESPFSVHIWSRPNPPGLAESYAFAKAVRAVLPTIQVDAGGRVYAATAPETEAPTGDAHDPRLIHTIVRTTFTTAPA